jgi:flagellar protein FlgJ
MTPVQGPLGAPPAAEAARADQPGPPKPELVKAAREFEAVFLRLILAPLEKATQVGKGQGASGGDAYGSMVVGALADSLSAAGGLGMADVIVESFSRPESAKRPEIGRATGKPDPAP